MGTVFVVEKDAPTTSRRPARSRKPPAMPHFNLIAAWIGILLGFLGGMIQGLYFHREEWLGGYGTWRRRMSRLGHISFFGLAFINIAYALSVQAIPSLALSASPWPSWLFLVGAATMPLVCYLSAWRKPLRHLFPIPALSLFAGAILFLVEIIGAVQ